MNRITRNTVELSNAEMNASDLFERKLDEGSGIDDAIDHVRKVMWMYDLSEQFYAWLRWPATDRPVMALYIENGMTIRTGNGLVRKIAETHYSGPTDGTGIVTLVFLTGGQWQGPASDRFEVVTS